MTVENVSDDVIVTRINGSLDRGGWQCDLTAMGNTDLFDRWQNVIVPWRGAFGGSFGTRRTAFNGWVLPSRIEFDRTASHANFVAQTTDGILRRLWLQGLGLADLDTVARSHYHQWDSITGGAAAERLTLGRIVRHILGFYDQLGAPPATNPDWIAHTNLVYHPTQNPHGWIHLDNVDVATSARVDRVVVRETDDLWSRLREIARWEFYEILFDKTDTLWYQPHPMYQLTLPNPVMTFDENFCLVPPTVIVRDVEAMQQVRLHAVTDTGDTMHGYYPLFNLCLNPSFEINITGWTAVGSAIARSNVVAYDGAWSLQITTNNAAANEGAYYTAIPQAFLTEFRGTIWAYQVAGGASLQLRLRDNTNGTETISAPVVLVAATWTQLTVTHTTGATPCTDLRLYIETSAMQNIVFFVDAAVIEPTAAPPSYGKKVDISRLRCNELDRIKLWAVRLFQFENRPYTVRWTAPGLCGLLFEILDRVQITYIGTSANGVGIDWNERKFWIHEINVVPDDKFGGRSEFLLEAENIDE